MDIPRKVRPVLFFSRFHGCDRSDCRNWIHRHRNQRTGERVRQEHQPNQTSRTCKRPEENIHIHTSINILLHLHHHHHLHSRTITTSHIHSTLYGVSPLSVSALCQEPQKGRRRCFMFGARPQRDGRKGESAQRGFHAPAERGLVDMSQRGT